MGQPCPEPGMEAVPGMGDMSPPHIFFILSFWLSLSLPTFFSPLSFKAYLLTHALL